MWWYAISCFFVPFVLLFLIIVVWQVKKEKRQEQNMRQKGREEICSCAHSNSEMNDSLEIILNKAEVGWADLWSLLAPVSF